MNNPTWELRNRVRAETLRELAMVARTGIQLTPAVLEFMASEVDKANASLDLVSVRGEEENGYDLSDPKHSQYHSTHADIWDLRDKGE